MDYSLHRCRNVSCCYPHAVVPSVSLRVLVLTKNKIITGLIAILSTLGFIFGVYAGIRSVFPSARNFAPLSPYVICWLGFQTSADLLITCVC